MGGEWSAPRPGRFTPAKDPVLLVQEAGWAPGSVWTGAEKHSPTGIRSPDRPARNESLYRLSYPGRRIIHNPPTHPPCCDHTNIIAANTWMKAIWSYKIVILFREEPIC